MGKIQFWEDSDRFFEQMESLIPLPLLPFSWFSELLRMKVLL